MMAFALMGARPVGVVAFIFLARLLDPRDFGVVALAMVLFNALDLFSGLGMETALIHNRLDKSQVAFPAFVVTLLTSVPLFLLVNTQSSFFAMALGDPDIEPVLRGMSIWIILRALTVVPNALLKRELMFRQASTALFIADLAFNGTALGMALLGFGVWSLVGANLARALAMLVVVWITCPGRDWLRPRPLDRAVVRDLTGYGVQSAGTGLLSYSNSNLDNWLVGRMLGPTALGFYAKAFNLAENSISGFNRTVIDTVLFPSYSMIQNEKERLSRAYIKSLRMVALIMTPLSMGVFAVAPELIPILLGEKWSPMVVPLQILTIMALFKLFAGSTSPLFLALGHPAFNLRAGLVIVLSMIPLIILFIGSGIVGVAFAVTIAYLLGFVYNIYQVHQILPGTGLKMIRAVLPAVVSSSAMILAVQVSTQSLLHLTDNQHNLVLLAAMVIVGAIVYLTSAYLTQRALIVETTYLILSALGLKRSVARQQVLDEHPTVT